MLFRSAELAVPDQDSLRQLLDSIQSTISNSVMQKLNASRRHLKMLSSSSALLSPEKYILQRRGDLQLSSSRLHLTYKNTLEHKKHRFITLTATLDAMSPLKVFTRGYSMTHTEDGKLVGSINDTHNGDTLHVRFADGTVDAQVMNIKESSI